MSGFFYFLPRNKGPIDRAKLKRFGLSHIADYTDIIEHRDIISGPNREPGTIVANRKNYNATQTKYSPDIRWWKFPKPDAERQALIGVLDEDDLPTPKDLERDKILDGERWTDELGQAWRIPRARRISVDPVSVVDTLPSTVTIGEEDGKYYIGKVLRRYQPLWEAVESFWTAMREASQDVQVGELFEVGDEYNLITQAFAANYRVSRMELSLLELLTSDNFIEILPIVIDSRGVTQLKKNPVPDTGTSSNGVTQSDTATSAETTSQLVPTT